MSSGKPITQRRNSREEEWLVLVHTSSGHRGKPGNLDAAGEVCDPVHDTTRRSEEGRRQERSHREKESASDSHHRQAEGNADPLDVPKGNSGRQHQVRQGVGM